MCSRGNSSDTLLCSESDSGPCRPCSSCRLGHRTTCTKSGTSRTCRPVRKTAPRTLGHRLHSVRPGTHCCSCCSQYSWGPCSRCNQGGSRHTRSKRRSRPAGNCSRPDRSWSRSCSRLDTVCSSGTLLRCTDHRPGRKRGTRWKKKDITLPYKSDNWSFLLPSRSDRWCRSSRTRSGCS